MGSENEVLRWAARSRRIALVLQLFLCIIGCVVLHPDTSAAPLADAPGRIAFIRNGSLWVCQGDGTNPHKLVFANGRLHQRYYFPSWLPDGNHITFTQFCYRDPSLPGDFPLHFQRVLVAEVNTQAVYSLFPNIGEFTIDSWENYIRWGRTAWHPQSQKAAVVCPGFFGEDDIVQNFHEDTLNLMVFDRKSLRWHCVKGGGYTPSWSRDGRKLVYASWPYFDRTVEVQERHYHPQRPFGIYVASLARLRRRQITQVPGDHTPVFARDGASILFLRFNRVKLYDGKRGRVIGLGALPRLKFFCKWVEPLRTGMRNERLLSRFPPEVAWSPDRRYVAFISPYDLKKGDSPKGVLYVSDIYGKNLRQVSDNAESPAWSPR